MNYMSNIFPNQQVEISLNTQSGEKIVSCYVKEVFPDRLVLTLPYEWEIYKEFLSEAEDIKTKIFTRFGVLLYEALILNSPESGEFCIEYNESAARVIQRRVFSRIPLETVVDCEYSVQKDIKVSDDQHGSAMTTYKTVLNCVVDDYVVDAETIDIGGGGLKIKAESELPYKKLITFKINLFDDIIVARGVLVENSNYPPLHYGVKFTQITPEDKDRIIKICFKIEGLLNRSKS